MYGPNNSIALVFLSARCSWNFNLVSGIKPRCLWLSDNLTWDWLRESGLGLLITILREKQTSIACFLGLGLKSIFHWKDRFLIIVRPSFNSRSDFLISWHFENKDVPFANILQIDWLQSGKSLIYINKNSCPSTDPWGTPERALSQEEVWPFRTTLCLRSVSNFQ